MAGGGAWSLALQMLRLGCEWSLALRFANGASPSSFWGCKRSLALRSCFGASLSAVVSEPRSPVSVVPFSLPWSLALRVAERRPSLLFLSGASPSVSVEPRPPVWSLALQCGASLSIVEPRSPCCGASLSASSGCLRRAGPCFPASCMPRSNVGRSV